MAIFLQIAKKLKIVAKFGVDGILFYDKERLISGTLRPIDSGGKVIKRVIKGLEIEFMTKYFHETFHEF